MTTKKKNKKRGRPRKPRPSKIVCTLPAGVRQVALSPRHPKYPNHRWVAFKDHQVVGYFTSLAGATKALL